MKAVPQQRNVLWRLEKKVTEAEEINQKSCIWRLSQSRLYGENLHDDVQVTALQLLWDFTCQAGILPIITEVNNSRL